MPRPGPRPYECVRRAWHSDRHQPIRGSLIQEIFRLANEVHCNATRNNKEWQEKLPFVVLRAEEIMYSKANSEAEYIDLKTLWDRANDAIDTIIRKDDANESGDLLPPCIEAALTLGCIPRRASRSQRHSNPVCYLSSNPKEPAHPPQKPQDIRNTHHLSPMSMPPPPPVHSGQLHSSLTPFPSKQAALGPEIQFLLPNPSKEQKSSNKELHFLESSIWPNLGRVYPPYYCSAEPCSFTAPPLFAPEFSIKPLPSIECDLSLRLGRQPPPTTEAESSKAQELEDVGSSSSCDGTKSCLRLPDTAGTMNLESVISPGRDKGFQFFALDEHCESFSSKRCLQRECVYTANVRHKIRKPSATVTLTDGCFSWKS